VALSELVLSHFRSHSRARLRFDGRPVVLFGANGAGKTNILEAISLLSPGRGIRRAAPDDIARKPEGIGWKVTAALGGHEVETWSEGMARQVRIDGKAAAQVQLGRVVRMVWLVPAMDRLWIEAPEGRRRFLDRIALSFFPGHAEATLEYDKAMRERNRLLRDGIEDGHWHGALEARMAEAGALIEAHRAGALERLAQALPQEARFPAPALTLETPEPWDDLAEALARGRRRDRAAGRTLVGPHRADLGAIFPGKGVEAAQASTGEQKAMLISVILANARALRAETGQAPILLLDEVAAHLDPSRRADLYDAICDLGAQAFLTGTEPALFDHIAVRAQRFALHDLQGQSGIEEVSQ
jgi:DNA replication and repair protein RecF